MLNAPRSTLHERLTRRLLYGAYFRLDDWDPQVTKNRLDAWEAPMREVLVYYRDKGRLVGIDADREVEKVRGDFGVAIARHT
jgi:adenylate kinase family enzyme